MRKLDSSEERKLITAVEEAVVETKNGLSPNAAIQKIAEKYSYTPPFIEIISNAFNKSKAAYIMKTASSEEKNSKFELADAPTIVKAIYGEDVPSTFTKVAYELPPIDYSKADISPFIEKAASVPEQEDRNAPKTVQSAFTILQKYASVKKLTEDKLKSDVAAAKYQMMEAMDKVAEVIRSYSDKQLQKTAQLVVNGYPQYGSKFMELMHSRIGRDFAPLEKTAHAAVFPVQEPYVSVAKVFDSCQKLANAENALRIFQKEATDSFLEDFLANTAANAVHGLGVGGENAANSLEEAITYKDKEKPLTEALSPKFHNLLKEIDTRRAFMNLALFDDDLKKYEAPDLIKAYNTSVQMVPTAYNNETVLKNMMLKNLETGGLKDIFELGAETDLTKKMQEIKNLKHKDDLEERKFKLEKDKAKSSFSPKHAAPKEPGFTARTLKSVSKVVGDGVEDYRKDKAKADAEVDKEKRKAEAGGGNSKSGSALVEQYKENWIRRGVDGRMLNAAISNLPANSTRNLSLDQVATIYKNGMLDPSSLSAEDKQIFTALRNVR